MTYALEYHRSEDTVEASQKWREQWIADQMEKTLGSFPSATREKLLKIVEEDKDLIYGQIEYIVKGNPGFWEPQAQQEVAHQFGRDVVQPIEGSSEDGFVRLTFASETAAKQAKAQIR